MTNREAVSFLADMIVDHYTANYSVSQIIQDFDQLGPSARPHIETLLKSRGIYQGIGGLSAQHKQQKIKATMVKRYGVENYGQLPDQGYRKLNAIPREPHNWLADADAYKDRVGELTKINKTKLLPRQYCYYTGIRFIDEEQEDVNPNDLRKRSLDHKISVWTGFITGISPEDISSVSNLVWCLRYCNTIKGNMNGDDFVPYAKKIKELMIHEGHKCSPLIE